MQVSDRHAGKDAALQGEIDLEVRLCRKAIGIAAPDAEKDGAVENQEERQEREQGTHGPPTPGAAGFVEGVAAFIHEGHNLFPRG